MVGGLVEEKRGRKGKKRKEGKEKRERKRRSVKVAGDRGYTGHAMVAEKWSRRRLKELAEREVGWRWERGGRRKERREEKGKEKKRNEKKRKMKFSKCFSNYIARGDFVNFFLKI